MIAVIVVSLVATPGLVLLVSALVSGVNLSREMSERADDSPRACAYCAQGHSGWVRSCDSCGAPIPDCDRKKFPPPPEVYWR